MIWQFGLDCILPPRHPQKLDEHQRDKEEEINNNNLEHNKAWLLAESGGCGAEITNVDPQSVHSSFRFSFCSQIELESINAIDSSSSATVLMVNLDNGSIESGSRELKWKRIESLERSISPVVHTLIRFSYAQILSATRNFSKGRVLGRGALSCVFRGRLGFLRATVAIKRLDKEDKESAKAFCRELMIASSLHNPYIVPLVGFCIDAEEGLFLVYKFASGGNLEQSLHERKKKRVKGSSSLPCKYLEQYLHERKKGVKGSSSLPWYVRYKIALGIAEAIGYLHNGTERCVVHRDIKPSNILLSSKKTPKLCDFGLATWTSAPNVPFLCKTVKGTFGYLAPEYFQHGKVSDKTDVYAFGVVLLELITGRKPIEAKRGPGEENLILWAKALVQQGAIEGLFDQRLKFTQKNVKQMACMVQAAIACINSEELHRPKMDEILSFLRGVKADCSNSTKKSTFAGNSFVIDGYSRSQNAKSEMKSHLALAMLGVSNFEDDDHVKL